MFLQRSDQRMRMKRRVDSLRDARKRRRAVVWAINTAIRSLVFPFALSNRVLKRLVSFLLPAPVHRSLTILVSRFLRDRPRVRRYGRPNLTLEELFSEIKHRGVNYVVLRWFKDLPSVQVGEDIDLLVDDEDLHKISDLFVYHPSGQAFDIYSVSGQPGANYKNVPYYPPHLARSILESRTWLDEVYAVPDTQHHFLSLAYHVVFHKGQSSGLPHCSYPRMSPPSHDYFQILQSLAREVGVRHELQCFSDFYTYLKAQGWTPQLDTMRILAANDPWLLGLLPDTSSHGTEGEMMVFVVRDWALEHGKLDFILDTLQHHRLDILRVHRLSQDERKAAATNLRGGKWDRGPYPVSGGLPACLIVCYDYHPERPSRAESENYPFVNNRHVFLKHAIRDSINAEMLWFSHTNCIHSADDELEAWHYLRQVIPSYLDTLEKQVEVRRRIYRTTYPVLELLKSNRTRAKVELIDYRGRQAVKKTFKIGKERFWEREAFVCEVFSKKTPAVPPLLERGPNYIIIPWYEDIVRDLSERERKRTFRMHAKTIVDTMRLFFDEGYSLVGFYPGNVLITAQGELKVIDFEFVYEYKNRPEEFALSYDIAGLPKGFDGDVPRGLRDKGHTYENTWQPLLGPLDLYV